MSTDQEFKDIENTCKDVDKNDPVWDIFDENKFFGPDEEDTEEKEGLFVKIVAFLCSLTIRK